MDTSGFYKLDSGQLLYAQYSLDFPDMTSITRENHTLDSVNGWKWFESKDEAVAEYEYVEPELEVQKNNLKLYF